MNKDSIKNEREAYVYVIGSQKNGRYKTYVGWTYDINERLKAHNEGKGAKSTKGRYWKLIHSEKFENKIQAMSREWYLKKDKNLRKNLLDDFKQSSK
jgi:putative endonuclease